MIVFRYLKSIIMLCPQQTETLGIDPRLCGFSSEFLVNLFTFRSRYFLSRVIFLSPRHSYSFCPLTCSRCAFDRIAYLCFFFKGSLGLCPKAMAFQAGLVDSPDLDPETLREERLAQ